MPVIENAEYRPGALANTASVEGYGPYLNAGAPSDGAEGTQAGSAEKGALLIDTTNGFLYENRNTKASPTWNQVGNIDTAEIADDAVTTAKIADANVTVAKTGSDVAYVERLGTPDLADADYFLVSVDMQATAYTLDQTTLAAGNPPRNITVTHAAVGTADTLGDLVVDGTDVDDGVISETITIASGTEAQGTKAFKTITALTTAGWVIDGVEATADTIEVGFGKLLGFSRTLSAATEVVTGLLNRAIQAPTIAVNATDVESNTVDMSAGTYNGTKLADVLLARP